MVLPDSTVALLDKLQATCGELNRESDALTERIRAIDAALSEMNVGLTAWDKQSLVAADGNTWRIGYAKCADRWCLVAGREGALDTMACSLDSAPRAVRVLAVDRIGPLLAQLTERAAGMLLHVRQAAGQLQK